MFGILNLNKPEGVTSRDVVNVVQRIVKPAKVGHAGTLDPMATGVLLVCVGGATRLISLLQESPKTYVAEFILGQRSNTDDSSGEVEHVVLPDPLPSETAIRAALKSFVGKIDQIPPAFSAVKVAGQRAYSKARRGEDVVLKPKKVMVHRIDVIRCQWPTLSLEIECGSGTYIRSIARDLGELLGCGGLMSGLQRTCIGDFDVLDGMKPNALTPENLEQHILNPVHVVSTHPQYRCTAEDLDCLRTGKKLKVDRTRLMNYSEASCHRQIAITNAEGNQLLAMADHLVESDALQPRMVFLKS